MKLYGLIGYPLGHSFSKKYFNEKFQREGVTGVAYELFPIASIKEFPSLLHDYPQLNGLNVTIPYKEEVLAYVDRRSGTVNEIGAANTLVIEEGSITAHNTDVIGFEKSFSRQLQPHHTHALVLGTGGSSKAVQFVLRKLGLAYRVVSREPQEHLIGYGAVNEELLQQFTVIINCTPLGLYPKVDECPSIPYAWLTPRHYLFDLIYRPEKTLFLAKGEAQGAAICNGEEMLVIQAEESWKIWQRSG